MSHVARPTAVPVEEWVGSFTNAAARPTTVRLGRDASAPQTFTCDSLTKARKSKTRCQTYGTLSGHPINVKTKEVGNVTPVFVQP